MPTDNYPLPLTVYRPYLQPTAPVTLTAGLPFSLSLTVRNPATDISDEAGDGNVYNEVVMKNYSVKGTDVKLVLSCEGLPDGAVFDSEKRLFTWTPLPEQAGEHEIVFIVDDGLIKERFPMKLIINSHAHTLSTTINESGV